MEFDLIVATELQVLVNRVQDYVKTGWDLKGDVFEKDGNFTQQVERRVAKQLKNNVTRQKSWIAWTASAA